MGRRRPDCTHRHIAVLAALVVAVAGVAALAAPARAASDGGSAALVRQAQRHARASLQATELTTPQGRYAYFTEAGRWRLAGPTGWAAGYHPGALWSVYQETGSPRWRAAALRRQERIGAQEISPASGNLGALFVPTYVRGYRLTGDDSLRVKALRATRAMAVRYDPEVGAVLSQRGDEFYNIIDSIMKCQLLWWAAGNGGDSRYADMAQAHALTFARDFVRPDGSTWHVCCYDPDTGAVTRREKGSAYSVDSTWGRGQAWAVLGFAAAYLQTGDERLLATARAVTDWYLANVPDDTVPFWDFGDPAIPAVPRDSSSAAIAAVGMLDLAVGDPDPDRRAVYAAAARETLDALLSSEYSSFGRDPAILLHGTYLIGLGADTGLCFGDAFFLEALLRLRRLEPDAAPHPVRSVRASAGDASAAVDGDRRTVWSSRGAQWVDLRLASAQPVGAVRVAVARGADRAAPLRVLVSNDGRHWAPVRRSMTSGAWAGFETIDFSPRTVTWVRVSVWGTTRSAANRLAEVEVYPPF